MNDVWRSTASRPPSAPCADLARYLVGGTRSVLRGGRVGWAPPPPHTDSRPSADDNARARHSSRPIQHAGNRRAPVAGRASTSATASTSPRPRRFDARAHLRTALDVFEDLGPRGGPRAPRKTARLRGDRPPPDDTHRDPAHCRMNDSSPRSFAGVSNRDAAAALVPQPLYCRTSTCARVQQARPQLPRRLPCSSSA